MWAKTDGKYDNCIVDLPGRENRVSRLVGWLKVDEDEATLQAAVWRLGPISVVLRVPMGFQNLQHNEREKNKNKCGKKIWLFSGLGQWVGWV